MRNLLRLYIKIYMVYETLVSIPVGTLYIKTVSGRISIPHLLTNKYKYIVLQR